MNDQQHDHHAALINDSPAFRAYLEECALWGAQASSEQFTKLQEWRSSQNKQKAKVQITAEDVRIIRETFDHVHMTTFGSLASVDTIHRAEWAHLVGLISADKLDALKTFWRRTC